VATEPEGTAWTITEYERGRAEFPIRTFLASLEGRNANEAAALLAQLAARGNQLREPRSKVIEGQRNLFELRGHQVRIFYMFRPGREIVLLDGVIKKQDRISKADLKRVLQYQRDVEHRGPRAL
jgi:hypothetical protein